MSSPITRREAIRKTVVFSTALLAAGWLPRLRAQIPSSSDGIHLLVFGDFGSKDEHQIAVARQMAAFAKKLGHPLTAVIALGDNFYGKLTADRFQKHFEQMYAADALPCPFYFCLGNHDYERASYGRNPEPLKRDAQLAYALEHPSSRWKQPARWYAVEFPDAVNPLVKLIVLDSNIGEPEFTPQEKLAQDRFFAAELQKPSSAPWLWVAAHHPLYSDHASRGDNRTLIKRWSDTFKNHPVSLYLAGHDHTLQHLEVEDHHTSFVVSGAGGHHLHDLEPTHRGFGEKIHGFSHIHVTPQQMQLQHIDTNGNVLHGFQRAPAGGVRTLT
jgi:tartrate-resistant acid phosphatase type 5